MIFCGHFPAGAETFTEDQLDGETRAQWYLRQMLGSANLDGPPLFHLMTGNLSHQIEHHLFPDMPFNRYAQVAPKVRALCERYGLPYTSGSLPRQYGNVLATIARLALPGGGARASRRPRRPPPPRSAPTGGRVSTVAQGDQAQLAPPRAARSCEPLTTWTLSPFCRSSNTASASAAFMRMHPADEREGSPPWKAIPPSAKNVEKGIGAGRPSAVRDSPLTWSRSLR